MASTRYSEDINFLHSTHYLTIRSGYESLLKAKYSSETVAAYEAIQSNSATLKSLLQTDPERAEDVMHLIASIEKIHNIADWRAKMNEVEAQEIEAYTLIREIFEARKTGEEGPIAPENIAFPPRSIFSTIQKIVRQNDTLGEPRTQEEMYQTMLTFFNETILSIKSTDHPTDEASEAADQALTELDSAKSLEEIDAALAKVHMAAKIDDFKRRPAVEVTRSIKKGPLAIVKVAPRYRKRVHEAMQLFFPRFYKEEEVREALHGDIRPGIWGGLEADGNTSIGVKETEHAMRELHKVSQVQLKADVKKVDKALGFDTVKSRKIERAVRKLSAAVGDAKDVATENEEGRYNATDARRIVEEIDTLLATRHNLAVGKIPDFQRELYQLLGLLGNGHNLIETIRALRTKYNDIIQANDEVREAFNILEDQIMDFGKGICGDMRMKSYVHREVFALMVHAFRTAPDMQNSPLQALLPSHKIFKHLFYYDKDRNKEVTIFPEYAEEMTAAEQLAFVMKLLDGSPESKEILAFMHNSSHFDYLAKTAKDQKQRTGEGITEDERVRYRFLHQAYLQVVQEILRHAAIDPNHNRLSIISNTESPLDLFIGMIIASEHNCITTPLLESKNDLDRASEILTPYFEFRIKAHLAQLLAGDGNISETLSNLGIENPESLAEYLRELLPSLDTLFDGTTYHSLLENPIFKEVIKQINVVVMLGYSDSEREDGVAAYITVIRNKETIQQLANDYGVTLDLFHGNGDDRNRGGSNMLPRHGTLQGRVRRLISSEAGALYYLEGQCHTAAMEYFDMEEEVFYGLEPEHQEMLALFEQHATTAYRRLYQDSFYKQTMAKTLSQWYFLIKMAFNSSSRNTSLGIEEGDGGRYESLTSGGAPVSLELETERLRAISKTVADEILRLNVNLTGGIMQGLAALKNESSIEKMASLYKNSALFRNVMQKAAIGLATANFDNIYAILIARHPNGDQLDMSDAARASRAATMRALEGANIDLSTLDKADYIEHLINFVAMIEEETNQGRNLMGELLHTVHPDKVPDTIDCPFDLLGCWPEIAEQLESKINSGHSIRSILSDFIIEIAEGRKLDTTLPPQLIGTIISNITAALNAIMEPTASFSAHTVRNPQEMIAFQAGIKENTPSARSFREKIAAECPTTRVVLEALLALDDDALDQTLDANAMRVLESALNTQRGGDVTIV